MSIKRLLVTIATLVIVVSPVLCLFQSTAYGEPYVSKGSVIRFGHYEQDNDYSNGPEPIEWRVLEYDASDNSALLISVHILDSCPHSNIEPPWETSRARAWLNNEFLSTAFSEEEQQSIATVTATTQGVDTQDKILLLSKSGSEQYFDSNKDRWATPTSYAIARGTNVIKVTYYTDGEWTGNWWLRSTGGWGGLDTACIDFFGQVTSCWNLEQPGFVDDYGIRPVMWLYLDNVLGQGITSDSIGDETDNYGTDTPLIQNNRMVRSDQVDDGSWVDIFNYYLDMENSEYLYASLVDLDLSGVPELVCVSDWDRVGLDAEIVYSNGQDGIYTYDGDGSTLFATGSSYRLCQFEDGSVGWLEYSYYEDVNGVIYEGIESKSFELSMDQSYAFINGKVLLRKVSNRNDYPDPLYTVNGMEVNEITYMQEEEKYNSLPVLYVYDPLRFQYPSDWSSACAEYSTIEK